jgi:hypothetical protein
MPRRVRTAAIGDDPDIRRMRATRTPDPERTIGQPVLDYAKAWQDRQLSLNSRRSDFSIRIFPTRSAGRQLPGRHLIDDFVAAPFHRLFPAVHWDPLFALLMTTVLSDPGGGA